MPDEDDEKDQDESQDPPRRLFTLTEAERARKEIEPALVEAMGCRKNSPAWKRSLRRFFAHRHDGRHRRSL